MGGDKKKEEERKKGRECRGIEEIMMKVSQREEQSVKKKGREWKAKEGKGKGETLTWKGM